jgi:acetyltransferase-like isoleucine patch superfamily enzyme
VNVTREGIAASAVVFPGTLIEEGVTIFPGAIIGRPPMKAGATHVPVHRGGETVIKKGTVIGCNAVIYEGVYIGNSVLVGDGATIRENCQISDQAIVGNNCTLQNDVHVGRRARIVDLSHITANVHVGDDAFVSTGVLTMNDNSMARGGSLRPPYISNRAMVGGGAILLPGVTIGEDALVGAGSVVTKDVFPNTRVQGVPARLFEARRESDEEIWAKYFFEYEEDRG